MTSTNVCELKEIQWYIFDSDEKQMSSVHLRTMKQETQPYSTPNATRLRAELVLAREPRRLTLPSCASFQ